MKKILHLVNIGDFFPELFSLSFPTVQAYAERCGYEINLITERKFPEFHINYEKMQVWEDGKDADVNLLVDADVLIHPHFPDVKDIVPPHHIAFNDNYNASSKFNLNDYFLRDGRDVGIASNFVVSYRSTHDLWRPLEITPDEGRRITFVREGDIDEYCISQNMSKYGLRYTGITWEPWQREFLIHTGTGDKPLALRMAHEALNKWKNL
tara:strand:+ start:1813 stop:2439 length:627 start_codon:yes stop_codon:yes gene_type:complete